MLVIASSFAGPCGGGGPAGPLRPRSVAQWAAGGDGARPVARVCQPRHHVRGQDLQRGARAAPPAPPPHPVPPLNSAIQNVATIWLSTEQSQPTPKPKGSTPPHSWRDLSLRSHSHHLSAGGAGAQRPSKRDLKAYAASTLLVLAQHCNLCSVDLRRPLRADRRGSPASPAAAAAAAVARLVWPRPRSAPLWDAFAALRAAEPADCAHHVRKLVARLEAGYLEALCLTDRPHAGAAGGPAGGPAGDGPAGDLRGKETRDWSTWGWDARD
eukprot:2912103-Pyramimonas_sp.AAC.1